MDNEGTDDPQETDDKSPGESGTKENPLDTTELGTSSVGPLDKKEKPKESEEPEKNESDKNPGDPPLNENGTQPQPENKTQQSDENESSSQNDDDNKKVAQSQPQTQDQNFDEDDSSSQNNDDDKRTKYVDIFEGPSRDDKFSDPTDTLRSEGHQLPKLATDEVEQYYKKLQEQRLIVLSCLDEEVATSAAYSIVSRPIFSPLEKRILQTDVVENKDRDDLSIDLLMEAYSFGEKPQGKDTIIVTILSDTGNSDFYGSLISGSLGSSKIEERLRNFNRFIICIIASTRLRERLISDRQNNEMAFEWIEIDYLYPLLRHHTRDAQEADELLEELKQQRNNGLWKEENEADFYEQIKTLIAQNALIEEITRRQQASDQGYTQYLETEIEKIKAAFKQEKTIECAVLYVATFFEQLNTTDFSKVVECLLAGKTQPTDEWEFTEGEETNTQLVDIWKKQRNKILNNYYITVVTLKDSTRVLDFSFPYLRRILRRYLEREQPYYLEEQFERLQQYGLLFDDSSKISQYVINLAVDMAASNPNAYGEEWLFRWIMTLLGNLDREISEADIIEQLRSLIMRHGQKQRVFSRMANLTKEMMQHRNLHQTVKKFLNKLIDFEFHAEVLEIIKRMRFVPDFEQLYWIKRLFAERQRQDEETRRKTDRFLYNTIKYSGSRFNEVIKQLYDWMPEPGKNPHDSVYMFPLFIDFLIDSTVAFEQSQYGQPTNHLVLAALIGKNVESQTFTKLLFHPDNLKILLRRAEIDSLKRLLLAKWNLTLRGGNYAIVPDALLKQLFLYLASHLSSQLDEALKKRKISNPHDLEQLLTEANQKQIDIIRGEVEDIIGVLIAEWFVIIHGLDDAQKNEEGIIFFELFLKQIISVVPARKKERTKELTECWKNMAKLIRGVIDNIKAQQQRERNKDRAQLIQSLALKEKRIKTLRKRLLALSKAS